MDIKIAWPEPRQWVAAGRYVVAGSAGIVVGVGGMLSVVTSLHILTPDQASGVTAGLTNVSSGIKLVVDGITSIAGGIATLAGIAATLWGAYASSRASAAKIASTIPDTVIVTNDALAKSTPGQPNIVSSAEVKVVPK